MLMMDGIFIAHISFYVYLEEIHVLTQGRPAEKVLLFNPLFWIGQYFLGREGGWGCEGSRSSHKNLGYRSWQINLCSKRWLIFWLWPCSHLLVILGNSFHTYKEGIQWLTTRRIRWDNVWKSSRVPDTGRLFPIAVYHQGWVSLCRQ